MTPTDQNLDFFGRPVAAHVPPELIRRIDVFDDAGMQSDPFELMRALRDQPPIIYNLHNPLKGQSWFPTRAEHVRDIVTNTELFSSEGQAGFSALIGENWKLGPVEMDPPEHGKFRQLMAPWLSPAAVAKLFDRIKARAGELIDAVAGQGGCEFMSSFGTPFPISIFMELMGLPKEHMASFVHWVDLLLHAADPAVKVNGAAAIADYLRTLISDRRANPIDDFASRIVTAEIDGKPMRDEDVLGICYLLFTGGLDTVASSLGFYFRHLAANPECQERLRRNPSDIPKAVEEYLRAFSPVQSQRRVIADTEIGGVKLKKGDWIMILYALASLDPLAFEKPDIVDFDRRKNRHFAFSSGPHFCLGAHLARREFQVAIQEWLTRLPPFRLVENIPVETHGGIVFGVTRLELRW